MTIKVSAAVQAITSTVSNPIISISDECKEHNSKFSMSKFEYDLYHEKDNIIEKIYRVKRIVSGNKVKWNFIIDNEIKFVLDCERLSKEEKEFLYKKEGALFMIKQLKKDVALSLSYIKYELKKIIDR